MSSHSANSVTTARKRSGGTLFRLPSFMVIVFAFMIGSGRWTARGESTRPPQAPFVLPADDATALVALRWDRGWMLARVQINGIDAGWFKIATGWEASCIDAEVAARLQLPPISDLGLLPTNGAEADGRKEGWFRADTLECGGARAEAVWLCAKDLAAMSEQPGEKQGEKQGEMISGVIGWDLLRTLPFLLDEAGSELTWQRQAAPATGAVRVALTGDAYPTVEVLVGDGVKAQGVVNTARVSVTFQKRFVSQNLQKVWQGHAGGRKVITFKDTLDDDQLPRGQIVQGWPSGRWVKISFGGDPQSVFAVVEPESVVPGDLQIGYAVLCRWRMLFDGPGLALWLSPASSVPEVDLVRKDRTPPSAEILADLLHSAIDRNDADAVRAVTAAGAVLNGKAPEDQSHLTRACYSGAREAALALLEAGARVDPFPGKRLPSTPLIGATVGDPDFVKTLLERGGMHEAVGKSTAKTVTGHSSDNPLPFCSGHRAMAAATSTPI